MLGVRVWDFKGEEGNSPGDGKANVWWTNICWAAETMWHSVDSDLQPLPNFPIFFADTSGDTSGPLSEFFRAVKGKEIKTLSLLFLKSNQPKLILMPKRQLFCGGWQILLLYKVRGWIDYRERAEKEGPGVQRTQREPGAWSVWWELGCVGVGVGSS